MRGLQEVVDKYKKMQHYAIKVLLLTQHRCITVAHCSCALLRVLLLQYCCITACIFRCQTCRTTDRRCMNIAIPLQSGRASGGVSGRVSGGMSGRVSGAVSGRASGRMIGAVSGRVSGRANQAR